jgi:hypothetical protein
MPILSDHAPHVGASHVRAMALYGLEEFDRAEPPARIDQWMLGYTWAFMIDLMDGNETVFRILYQDAAAAPRNAFPPKEEIDRRPVDVNIACVPGFDLVHEYPDALLHHAKARYVLLGHWESFFRSRDRRLKPIPFTTSGGRMNEFVGRIAKAIGLVETGVAPEGTPKGPYGANWALPVPGETFRFSLPAKKP